MVQLTASIVSQKILYVALANIVHSRLGHPTPTARCLLLKQLTVMCTTRGERRLMCNSYSQIMVYPGYLLFHFIVGQLFCL